MAFSESRHHQSNWSHSIGWLANVARSRAAPGQRSAITAGKAGAWSVTTAEAMQGGVADVDPALGQEFFEITVGGPKRRYQSDA